ncbi:MAG TPA: radical SAM family heme chaperone HemW [candidate division Zixibacteria bacterium]|mgnify:CR=1 FL=1|nr:radical SAM family heme chaperone HemW [candidate division Zixibacteria bacterium]
MSFGLYLHYPFCANHCSYCDFYKEHLDNDIEHRFWSALAAETDLTARKYGSALGSISTIYVGGGTPSLMNLDSFRLWLRQVECSFPMVYEVEFSFECNPESVSLELLDTLKTFGVNRPLFGVQSFYPALLRLLGRRHDLNDTHRAIYHANALEFKNYGIDLIFGLPGQKANQHSADLDEALKLAPPHISYYQLTVESGTPLEKMLNEGRLRQADPELVAAMYREGCDRLTEAGYHHYEVSSFARPGYECRHNQGYWDGSAYLGLGPSAHSFIGNRRFFNPSDLKRYVELLKQGRLPAEPDPSSHEERIVEAIMLGLRTSRGVRKKEFVDRFGVSLATRLSRKTVAVLIESGHLIEDDEAVRLTEVGICLADEITRQLLG